MIDENDAPEGYKAAMAPFGCHGCAFYDQSNDDITCDDVGQSCMRKHRADKSHVIFVKRETNRD